MESTKQVELARRALAHIAARTTDRDPEPTTVPVDTYIDEKRYAHECDVLFRKTPVVVAHASQLASPGDFVTHDATGVPLLIVRGDDGALNAFLNVCRHRGTRVENEPSGQKRIFVCPYHAWCYGRDGHLDAIPHEHGFPGVKREERGLVRVPAGEAGGLVWAIATPAKSPDELRLDPSALLGHDIAEELAYFGIGSSHVYTPKVSDREMNWKLAIDIFLETYHLRPTHKNTIYPLFFDNLGLVDRLGPHLRTVLPKRSIRGLATEPEDVIGSTLRLHANIVYFLFPNTIVLIQPDHASVVNMWPLGIGRTRFAKYTLVPEPPDNDEKAKAHWDLNNTIVQFTTEEDIVLGESIQKGLNTGANREVVFGAFEHALAHFHAEIAKRLSF